MKSIKTLAIIAALIVAIAACKKNDSPAPPTQLEINRSKILGDWYVPNCNINLYCDTYNFAKNGTLKAAVTSYDSFNVITIDSMGFYGKTGGGGSKICKYAFIDDSTLYFVHFYGDFNGDYHDITFKRK